MNYAQTANKVLGVTFILFLAIAVVRHYGNYFFITDIVYAALEAALVGGIADWFAVTALFRRPLGFPWHTAIIPRNRQRIAQSLAAAVQNELLDRETIKKHLDGIRIVDYLAGWLETADGKSKLTNLVVRCLEQSLTQAEPRGLAGGLEKAVKDCLARVKLAPLAGRLLSRSVDNGNHAYWLNALLAETIRLAKTPAAREGIYRYLYHLKKQQTQTWWQRLLAGIAEQTDAINLLDASGVLQQELVSLLEGMKSGQHPLRSWIDDRLTEIADTIQANENWAESMEAWKSEFLDRFELADALTELIEKFLTEAKETAIPLQAAEWLLAQAGRCWNRFKADQAIRDWLERQLKDFICQLINSEQEFIGTVIKEALARKSDEDLNRFIEEKAGPDLAWIRINGAVVGGCVGLLMFLFMQYVYQPFVAPVVRNLFL